MVVALIGLVPGSGGRLDNLSVGWMALAVVIELTGCAGYALLFRIVFSHGEYTVSRARSTQVAIGELGAFAVVPTGAGGPVLRIWGLTRGGMPFRVVVERSVVHGAIFNLPYLAAGLVLGIPVLAGVGPGHASTLVALAPIGVFVVGAGTTVAVVIWLRRRVPDPAATSIAQPAAASTLPIAAAPDPSPARSREDGLRGLSLRSSADRRRLAGEAAHAVPAGLRQLAVRVREPRLVLLAAAYWVSDCAVLFVAFHAAHGSATPGVVLLGYMLGQVGNLLPLPGGIGGVEPIMLAVLTASGVNGGLGAAAIVVYRFVSLGIQTVLGTIATAALAASPSVPEQHSLSVADP